MARVSNVEIDAVPDDVKPVYERFASEYGPFLNRFAFLRIARRR